jgi:hypothetical protein
LIEIYEKILSIKNEFYLAHLLNRINPIKFTSDVKIADFEIVNKNIFMDTKINIKTDTTLNLPTKSLHLSFDTLLMLVIKNGFKQIEHAFDEQKANIVMVNLSLTLIGSLIETIITQSNDSEEILQSAIDVVKNGEQVVIFYVIRRGNVKGGFFVCFPRENVIQMGRTLDKIQRDITKSTIMKLNSWDFIEIFQNLNDLNKRVQ